MYHTMKSAVLHIILIILISGSLHAEIYSWLDKKGVRHYSDISPGRGENIIDLQVFDTEPPPPPPVKKDTNSSAADTTINTSKSVLMYVEPDCDECARARAFFNSSKIRLFEMDIASDKAAAAAFARIGGSRVPLIIIGKSRIEGFDQPAIIKALAAD